jgi:hypothetical protein
VKAKSQKYLVVDPELLMSSLICDTDQPSQKCKTLVRFFELLYLPSLIGHTQEANIKLNTIDFEDVFSNLAAHE